MNIRWWFFLFSTLFSIVNGARAAGAHESNGAAAKIARYSPQPRHSLSKNDSAVRADRDEPYCADLSGAICSMENTRGRETEFEQTVNRFVKQFQKAEKFSFRRFSELLSNVARSPMNPRINEGLQKYLNYFSASTPSINAVLENTAKNLSLAVQNMPISESAKARMLSRLAEIKFRTSPPFDDAREIGDFIQQCGPDGMSPSAYALFSSKNVVVCPGLILRASALGDISELERYLFYAIGHEATHQIGADILVSDKGLKIGESPFRAEFKEVLACYANNFPEMKTNSMGGEIAADIGSGKAMVERLRGSSRREAFEFVKASFGPLCGTRNDGVHPSGKSRINVILGQEPGLAALLGCSPKRTACEM